MKKDPNLRGLYAGRRPERPRMSVEVVAPYLVAAAAVGLPLAIGIASCAREPKPEKEEEPPTVVNADTVYPNNHFLPGAGYYHAPYRGWFPLPFNHHENGRGWFRGGDWRPTPQADAAERGVVGGGGRTGAPGAGTSSFAESTATRPTPAAVQRANAAARAHTSGIMRGGFGHSSRPSIS